MEVPAEVGRCCGLIRATDAFLLPTPTLPPPPPPPPRPSSLPHPLLFKSTSGREGGGRGWVLNQRCSACLTETIRLFCPSCAVGPFKHLPNEDRARRRKGCWLPTAVSAREQQILSTGQALTVRGANISFCQEPRYLRCPVTRPSRGHLSGSCSLLCGGGVVGRFSPRPGLVVVAVVLTVGRVWSACCCCTCWARRLGPGIRPPGEDLTPQSGLNRFCAELGSCVNDHVDVLGSPSLRDLLMVFVDVKQHHVKKKKNLFCPNVHWFRQNVLQQEQFAYNYQYRPNIKQIKSPT